MATPCWKTHFLGAACAFALLLLTAGGLCWRVASSPETVPLEGYYRAVCVLRHLSPLAGAEPENVPARVNFADATESLLHHPDKILVLRQMAEQCAHYREQAPKAALFEAYAHFALGEQKEATALLMRYVTDGEYRPDHYELLCDNLYAMGEYSLLLLMCREWTEKDAASNPSRAAYLWIALYNLKRYDDAAAVLAEHEVCLGWKASVFAAKTALARGRQAEAADRLRRGLSDFSQEALHIQRMWERIRPLERV